jgi:hypothetical protein
VSHYPAAFGEGPYSLAPVALSTVMPTRWITGPTTGIRAMSILRPDLPVSCSRRTETASMGLGCREPTLDTTTSVVSDAPGC